MSGTGSVPVWAQTNPTTATTKKTMTTSIDPAESLRLASQGFDLLFANDLVGAVDIFSTDSCRESPFHLMGLGVCAFLKAALGMEVGFLFQPSHCSSQLSTLSPSLWKRLHIASRHHRPAPKNTSSSLNRVYPHIDSHPALNGRFSTPMRFFC